MTNSAALVSRRLVGQERQLNSGSSPGGRLEYGPKIRSLFGASEIFVRSSGKKLLGVKVCNLCNMRKKWLKEFLAEGEAPA